jgi:hypothetical protein
MMNTDFWYVALCGYRNNRRFVESVIRVKESASSVLLLLDTANFFSCPVDSFYRDNGCDMFLRNVGS